MAMAGIYLANNDSASAERIYKKAIAAKSDVIEPLTALANLYFKQGKTKDSENELKRQLRLNLTILRYAFCWQIYTAAKRFSEVEKTYESVITLKPDNPNGYLILTEFYLGKPQASGCA